MDRNISSKRILMGICSFMPKMRKGALSLLGRPIGVATTYAVSVGGGYGFVEGVMFRLISFMFLTIGSVR